MGQDLEVEVVEVMKEMGEEEVRGLMVGFDKVTEAESHIFHLFMRWRERGGYTHVGGWQGREGCLW